MHKKDPPDKRADRPVMATNAARGAGSRNNATNVKPARGQPDSVKNLLARGLAKAAPVLAGITRQAALQRDIEAWTRQQLPADLAGHVTAVLEKDGELVVFAESAAWAGRLRYAVEGLKATVAGHRPDLTAVRVRVMPRGSRG